MFKLVYFTLVALAAVSLVNGAAILRRTPPSGWSLESREVSVSPSSIIDAYLNPP